MHITKSGNVQAFQKVKTNLTLFLSYLALINSIFIKYLILLRTNS